MNSNTMGGFAFGLFTALLFLAVISATAIHDKRLAEFCLREGIAYENCTWNLED